MPLQLSKLTALSEDQDSITSTHMVAHNSGSWGSPPCLGPMAALGMQVVHGHAGQTLRHILNDLFIVILCAWVFRLNVCLCEDVISLDLELQIVVSCYVGTRN